MADAQEIEELDNGTRRQVAEAVASGIANVALDSNPALCTLGAILVGGKPGDVAISFLIGLELTQGNGVVGGGTIANMLDTAMAMSVLSMLKAGQTCSSISLTVNMLRPAMAGRLLVRARVEKLGGRVAFAHAELEDKDGKCLANASSSLAVISAR